MENKDIKERKEKIKKNLEGQSKQEQSPSWAAWEDVTEQLITACCLGADFL